MREGKEAGGRAKGTLSDCEGVARSSAVNAGDKPDVWARGRLCVRVGVTREMAREGGVDGRVNVGSPSVAAATAWALMLSLVVVALEVVMGIV